MDGAKHPGMRRWLSAARHPARRDGVIAAALLVVPWVLAWALVPRHHLDATTVTILVSATIPLAGVWLTWATLRNASTPSPADSRATPGSAVPDPGEAAIRPVVYRQRRGVTGKPVRLADPPPLLAGREGLFAELDTRMTGGTDSGPRTAIGHITSVEDR